MVTKEKLLGTISGVETSRVLLYETPKDTFTYINTINVASVDGPQGILSSDLIDTDLDITEEGLTLDGCFLLRFRSMGSGGEVVMYVSRLVPYYDTTKNEWTPASLLQMGVVVMGGSSNYTLIHKEEIEPLLVSSYLPKKENDKVVVKDLVVGSPITVGVTIEHEGKDGVIRKIINSDIIKANTNKSYLWNLPLNVGDRVHVIVTSKRVEVVSYGVEINRNKLDTSYFGEFVLPQTVMGEQIVFQSPEGTFSVISNVIFSCAGIKSSSKSMSVGSGNGKYTMIPLLKIKTGYSEDYRMGTHQLPNIQLSPGEFMMIKSDSPLHVTVYGHYQSKQ